jgi:hypothetical protein
MHAKFIEITKGKYTSLEEEINDGIQNPLEQFVTFIINTQHTNFQFYHTFHYLCSFG